MKTMPTSAVLGCLLLAGAAPAAYAACEVQGGKIQAAMTTNASTMDAILSTTNASRQVAIYLFESLVTYDENYQVIPQLAESWVRSDDGLTYIFTLRDGIKFHNGKTMTADDVTASVQRFLKVSPGAGRFKNVQSVETIDPKTVKFTLKADFPFLSNLAIPSPTVAIYPADIVAKYGDKEVTGADIIGTGPYKLNRWRPDVSISMSKFPDYVTDTRFKGPTGFGGARTACADEVNFLPVPEEAARVAGLQTGDFDYAEALPITAVPQLEGDKALKIEIVKPRWAILVELDHKDPWVSKKPFRKALEAAINPEQILQAASFGRKDYYRVQPSIFFPEQKQWYSEAGAQAYNAPNADTVKKLLAEAGYNGEPITFITNQNYSWMFKASQALAAQWQKAGINVKLELMDWPSQIKRAQEKADWGINQTGWSPRLDPFQTLSSLQCGTVSAFGYCNQAMEGALAKVNSGLPDDERKKAWAEVQQIVWDDLPVIRIGDYFEPEGTRTTLKGYIPFYVTPRFWDVSQTKK
ncbi:ABC transporter substrate-binding protein [Chelatococcus asaccharovorans]|uniref:ABC transporter substrate-binding protein n=1 Tax=Chelatococcus asaccharovorans TaxID=28210 RepID=UPI00224C6F60|nr:ABC transporter substrate-binding protein [Chelatococcus asaccharovorans]CAH1673962.1 Peptide/nickel transport system substrate-binding protein [Chelatococcus asaccharovorans]CAH1674662.1 Peptide/nickel transport system substrate-binding protein [Chelatococcus asaccharovorans]